MYLLLWFELCRFMEHLVVKELNKDSDFFAECISQAHYFREKGTYIQIFFRYNDWRMAGHDGYKFHEAKRIA